MLLSCPSASSFSYKICMSNFFISSFMLDFLWYIAVVNLRIFQKRLVLNQIRSSNWIKRFLMKFAHRLINLWKKSLYVVGSLFADFLGAWYICIFIYLKAKSIILFILVWVLLVNDINIMLGLFILIFYGRCCLCKLWDEIEFTRCRKFHWLAFLLKV